MCHLRRKVKLVCGEIKQRDGDLFAAAAYDASPVRARSPVMTVLWTQITKLLTNT